MSERASLAGCRVKIDRARENLDTLQSATEAFLKRGPYAAAVDDNPKTGWVVVSLRTEATPARLSAIAGDALHDLRSALDHLVWQLVIAERGTPGDHNAFPIYSDEEKFCRGVTERSDPTAKHPGPLAGLSPRGKAWALIEREQPYKRRHPEETVLDALHTFSNIDKHRALLAGVNVPYLPPTEEAVMQGIQMNPAAILLDKEIFLELEMPLKPRTDLARFRFDPDGPEPQVSVDHQFPVQITFGDGKRQATVSDFDRFRVSLSTLFDEFEGLIAAD